MVENRKSINIFFSLCSLLFILLTACNNSENKENSAQNNHTYSGYNVAIFLSPECPLSENYTNTINELYKKYEEKGVGFCIIFPGDLYSDQEIKTFIDSFHVEMIYKIDREKTLTKRLGATITPEVFLSDRSGSILYSGAIDDRAIELTRLRENISKHYLRDALDAVLAGQPIKIKRTQAVGCLIE